MGVLAGYVSSRLFKTFNGKSWQLNTLLTAVLCPGATFAIFFVLNLFVWASGSDAAVPFGSIIVILLLWCGISIPLVFIGSWIGYKKNKYDFPTSTSNIPRPIPTQQWYMSTTICMFIGGILPFGAIFVELFFILTSLWQQQYYYVFGFLSLVYAILIGTCA